MLLVLIMCLALLPMAAMGEEAPIKFSITYSDNPTLPFKQDWLVVTEANRLWNMDATWEIIPSMDYSTKVLSELGTETNLDVIMYLSPTSGEAANLALGGTMAPISDYVDMGWTPNFSRRIEEWNMQAELEERRLSDGKYYFLPTLYDKQFFDGGLILRDDLLAEFNMEPPKTFDDLYAYMKACKERDPNCFPLTHLVAPYVTWRMSMPSWGFFVGRSAGTTAQVLSWDYENKEYFPAAISEQYKAYFGWMAKLYAEGLLDPEFWPEGDMWATKMATGAATVSYAYYDQIGGLIGNSEIEGISFNMYPPLEGPYGAYHQPKTRLAGGPVFTADAQKRPDFERLVRTIEAMCYSDEAAILWCLGVEGKTFYYDNDGKVAFYEEALNAPDGVYKFLQVTYGMGADPSQQVWINAQEMLKYDENYAAINAVVAEMDGIPPLPTAPMLSEDDAERASMLIMPLRETMELWTDYFIMGEKDLEADWDEYVAEMQSRNLDELCQIYNDSRR
jgi:putative aldouronate transport system substrate-binding protein